MMVERKKKAQSGGQILSNTLAGLVPSCSAPLYLHTNRVVISLIFKMCQKHCKFPKVHVCGYLFSVIFRAFLSLQIIYGISVQNLGFIAHGNQEPVTFNLHIISTQWLRAHVHWHTSLSGCSRLGRISSSPEQRYGQTP